MNALLNLNETDKLHPVSARELYEWLGFDLKNWAKWHKKNITGNQFAIEGQDYISLLQSTSEKARGNFAQDFNLSIDFAKRLSMLARTEKGEEIRKWFVEVEKKMTSQLPAKPLTAAEALLQSVQQIVELEHRQTVIEEKVYLLEAKTTTRPDWFTIVGYATLKKVQCGLTLAAKLGKKAQMICKQRGIEIEKIPDPRFGRVGLYPSEVLEEVFKQNVA